MSHDFEISLDAPPRVRDALKRIGRTEDVCFSPNNRRMALACLGRDTLAIVDVAIKSNSGRPHVAITGAAEYSSPHLMTPHGVDFLDNDTIIVGNREGKAVAFRLPSNSNAVSDPEVQPIMSLPGDEFELVNSPGSIAIIRAPDAPVEVLLCDNRKSSVTRHTVEGDPFRVLSNDILLRRLLDFPDSVAVTEDNRWIAVSNHHSHVVMLYHRTRSLSEDSNPQCILRGTLYPHGLQFSADGRHLFVADAGSPHLHIYARDGEAWRGVRYPKASMRVMSDDIFEMGLDPEGRGPKGVAIDNNGHVLAATYENQPMAFFDIAAMLKRSAETCPDDALQLSYEMNALELERVRRETAIAALMGSTSFRITEPLRRLNAAWSKTRR
jgi:DNA-binding beta-propeller fold protein YncE